MSDDTKPTSKAAVSEAEINSELDAIINPDKRLDWIDGTSSSIGDGCLKSQRRPKSALDFLTRHMVSARKGDQDRV